MADLQLPLDSPVANGLLGQLLDMGGPVMMVLLVIAVIGLATFVYLMLLGTLYAPRLPAKLKKIITERAPGAGERIRSAAKPGNRRRAGRHIGDRRWPRVRLPAAGPPAFRPCNWLIPGQPAPYPSG